MIASRSAVEVTATSAHASQDRVFKAAGLAFAAIVPALFWMGILAAAGPAFGYTIAPAALMALGTAIAVFLAAVCAPIMLRS